MANLAEGDGGFPASDLYRKRGISSSLYSHWMSKYPGVLVNKLKRMRERG